jgi:tetratricopeptide (TPR) repeat protein
LRIAVRLSGAPPGQRRAAGLIANANRLLERAETASPELRGGILAGMSTDALYVRGDMVAAEALARRALAEGPTAGGALVGAYTTLSICAAIDGEHERALEVLLEGKRAMKQLGFDTFHNDAYFEFLIANVENARGDSDAAKLHATEAVRLARQAHLPMRLAQALTGYARVHHDDPKAAEQALDEVIDMAPETIGALMLGWALSARAELCVTAGDAAGAVALFHRALVAYGDDVPVLSIIRIAAHGVTIFAALAEPVTAAILAGAVTVGHNARLMRYMFDEQTRTDLDRTVERLRATLGADAYDTAAAHGAAMSTDDLHRFLRRVVDDALAISHT